MKRIIILFLLCIIIYSCKKDKESSFGIVLNEERFNYKNNYTLIQNGTKEFLLDEETVNLIGYMQYIDSLECLSFLNSHNRSIYFYNDKTHKFLHKIKFDDANKIGKIDGYYYLDSNNIFVYSYHTKTLFWTNSNSNIKANYLMSNDPNGSANMIYPAPYIQTLAPLKKYQNKIVSVGFVSGETSIETAQNRVVCTILDLDDKSLKNAVNYPEMYVSYNWAGGFTYRMPSYDLVDESIIINFPANHYLIRYSLSTGEQESFYAGSSFIESVKSFPCSKDARVDETLAWNWYMNNPSYESILYDKYKKLYYRIARLPLSNYDKNEKGNRKPIVIIILDANMNYKGEVKLPTHILFCATNCYVSKEGFNIQVWTEDEDKLVFNQYNFVENEN
jgi:hypothetical protein